MTIHEKKDPFGKACLAYLKGIKGLEIVVASDHAEDDTIPVDYLFRKYENMPLIEQTALDLCRGKILDIGAGAGCHSSYLKSIGHNITAIDQSPGAVTAMKEQNISAKNLDFFNLNEEDKYDTLIALMNGTGIAGTVENFSNFLVKCSKLLNYNGQLLIDSSDIIYLFENDEELYNFSGDKYYGEVEYQMKFDNESSDWFNWLYLSYGKLQEICKQQNCQCEMVVEGDHFDYLAKISFNH